MDSEELRAALRAMWASAAPSWGEHADYVDTRGAAVAEAMLAAARLQAGERVLELACGPGGVGIAAATIVGPNGAVVLSDVAPEMTAIAAERAKAAGLTNVTSGEVDLERIDFPPGCFDSVLCREGLMLTPEPANAVGECHRVLRPGGRAVFAVWGPRELNPWLGLLFDAVTAETGMPVPPPGVPGPFSLEKPGALDDLLTGAGFADVAVANISNPVQVASVDDWWSVVPSLAGPISGVLASLPAEVNAAIRARIGVAMQDFATPDGYGLPGVSLVGVGHR
jgi:SAM-dependent methyltransferase